MVRPGGAKPPAGSPRRLGQNFLADPNLLDVIVREAELAPSDVVLEVGGGGGALTERLARAVARVHVIEIDERLRDELRALAHGAGNVALVWGDAMKVILGDLIPAPNKVVANLPYSIATPLLIRTIAELPSLELWVVMVQREIADRLIAEPGTREYGSASVLVQLACEVRMLRSVDPAVFVPRPRVGSALLRLRRTGPGASESLAALVRLAFAHRRKSLARSLELLARRQPGTGQAGSRLDRQARGRAGRDAVAEPVRAVRGGARDARRRRVNVVELPGTMLAPAKLNLCLYVGPRREDGLHEIRSLFEPLELADELRVTEAGEDEVICEGIESPDLTAQALAALREHGWSGPALRIEVTKRVPVAAGLGGGSADAAAVLRLARGEVEGLRSIAAGIGADVPSQLQPRPCLVAGAGEVIEPAPPPADHGVVLIPQPEGLATAEVYAEADRLGSPRGESELEAIRRGLRDAVDEGGSPLDYREHLVNDLQPGAISLRPEIEEALSALEDAGAAHAMVTGSGPTAFGLYPSPEEAADAAAPLRERFPEVVATAPLST